MSILANLKKNLIDDFGKTRAQRAYDLEVERMRQQAELNKELFKAQIDMQKEAFKSELELKRQEADKERREKAGRVGSALMGQDRVPGYSFKGLMGEDINVPGITVDKNNYLAAGMSMLNEAEAAQPTALANEYLRGLGMRPAMRQLGTETVRADVLSEKARGEEADRALGLGGVIKKIGEITASNQLARAEQEKTFNEKLKPSYDRIAQWQVDQKLNDTESGFLSSLLNKANATAVSKKIDTLAPLAPQALEAQIKADIAKSNLSTKMSSLIDMPAPGRDDGLTVLDAAKKGDYTALTLLSLITAGQPLEASALAVMRAMGNTGLGGIGGGLGGGSITPSGSVPGMDAQVNPYNSFK